MSETAEQQRTRLAKKREAESDEELIKCLECPLKFRRVGSHVVQVHGYENVAEYRYEHGLMARETRLDSHATAMRAKAKTVQNLTKGIATRFTQGGRHGETVTQFWQNRKAKREWE